jgi:2-hydroxychromene-2-carboxylate isomerase
LSDAPSTSEPFRFSAPLTVCVDVKSPHAYLAKDLLYELEDDLGVAALWLPYLVPAMSPPAQPSSNDDRGARHRQHRARYVERDIQRYAKVRGLVIRDIYRHVDSTLAAIALLWLAREATAVRRRVTDALFAGYWEGALDIEDAVGVTRLMGDAGVDLSGWDDYCTVSGDARLQQLRAELRAAGIFNVPALVVSDDAESPEIFYGRAHLPMVRWLLSGKAGPPPI